MNKVNNIIGFIIAFILVGTVTTYFKVGFHWYLFLALIPIAIFTIIARYCWKQFKEGTKDCGKSCGKCCAVCPCRSADENFESDRPWQENKCQTCKHKKHK